MERLNSMFYFVILYSILILASEVDIMESSIIHKEKRSYKVRTVLNSLRDVRSKGYLHEYKVKQIALHSVFYSCNNAALPCFTF